MHDLFAAETQAWQRDDHSTLSVWTPSIKTEACSAAQFHLTRESTSFQCVRWEHSLRLPRNMQLDSWSCNRPVTTLRRGRCSQQHPLLADSRNSWGTIHGFIYLYLVSSILEKSTIAVEKMTRLAARHFLPKKKKKKPTDSVRIWSDLFCFSRDMWGNMDTTKF